MNTSFCTLHIFTQTGIILWTNAVVQARELVNEFIESVILLEQKSAGSLAKQGKILTWQFNNKFKLVFLAISSSVVAFRASVFLRNARTSFIYTYDKELQTFYTTYNTAPFSSFTDKFTQCLNETIVGSVKNKKEDGEDSDGEEKEDDEEDGGGGGEGDAGKGVKGELTEGFVNKNALQDDKDTSPKTQQSPSNHLASLQEKARSLRAANKKSPQIQKQSPDVTSPKSLSEKKAAAQLSMIKGSPATKNVNKVSLEEERMSSSSLVLEDPTTKRKRLFGLFKASLSDSDLEDPIEKVRELLISRNVSAVVSDALCSSIRTSLVGIEQVIKNPKKAVYEGVVQAISGMISRNQYDIMGKIKGQLKLIENGTRTTPVSIVFVGVNGVGKSTSLAKVAYHLRMSDVTPMVCACDTFRSGAIEQLKRHTDALGLELYAKGYGKSPDSVMKSAMATAHSKAINCVLVDTAGRMQNNKPLMEQLVSLVETNNPDFILFIGEALCGGDIMDQIKEYDSSLKSHKIDAVLLSKYDCVSNNTGGLLNVIYELKKPIAFVGTGQRYNDLAIPTPEMLVETLLSRK